MRRFIVLIASLVLLSPDTVTGGEVDYVKQIKPILVARCYACHSALRKKSGLRVDTAAELISGGDAGPAVVPGKSADSYLISMLTGESCSRMPPENEGAALTAEQIAIFKKWLDEGAHAPAETPPPDPRDHWSYHPPVRPQVPQVRDASSIENPVDAFIAAQRESQG